MPRKSGPLDRLDALERRLIAKGFPALSPFWRTTLGAFYRSARRQLVLRVGRRGGKSSSLCRIAVLEALYGQHVIPPGDVGVVAIISVSRDEASQRLRTIRAVLDALDVPHHPVDGGIELDARPVIFKTFAASVAGVSGFTAICAICDEVAKWRDADSGANPASEVLASLRPTTATQRRARVFLSSSPLGTEDAHARAFDEGNTPRQLVAHAPTWIANPTVTEAETRELEPDDRIWLREYAAQPQAGALGAFDPEAVDRAFRPVEVVRQGRSIVVVDPSSGRKDAWTWAVCHRAELAGGESAIVFELIDGVSGRFFEQVSSDAIVNRVASLAKARGGAHVHSDQRESYALASAFRGLGVPFHAHDWTAQSKVAAVERLRRWFAEGTIVLPEHDKLRRELLGFQERITSSGSFTFGARGNGHDDFVALLITAAMAEGAMRAAVDHDGPTGFGFSRGRSVDDLSVGGDEPHAIYGQGVSAWLAHSIRTH